MTETVLIWKRQFSLLQFLSSAPQMVPSASSHGTGTTPALPLTRDNTQTMKQDEKTDRGASRSLVTLPKAHVCEALESRVMINSTLILERQVAFNPSEKAPLQRVSR